VIEGFDGGNVIEQTGNQFLSVPKVVFLIVRLIILFEMEPPRKTSPQYHNLHELDQELPIEVVERLELLDGLEPILNEVDYGPSNLGLVCVQEAFYRVLQQPCKYNLIMLLVRGVR